MRGQEPAEEGSSGRLVAVELDESSFAGSHSLLETERAAAVRDLVEQNTFVPAGRTGTFRLRLSIVDGKLALDVSDSRATPVVRHILSLTPLGRVIKDYFLLCESYRAAAATRQAAQVEAIDMGRRGVHNEGAEALRRRLEGKIDIDFDTARRLFTLVCALHWKG